MRIDSLDNKKIKYIVKLKDKSFRDKEGKFIVETYNLINEAYNLGLLLEVYVLDDIDISFNNVDVYKIPLNVMKKISDLNNSRILGIVKKIDSDISGERLLLLDKIQDPGNLGTIIRSAVAFNVSSIIVSDDSCDIYNQKVIRASEGAIFKIPIVRKDLKNIIEKLKEKNIPILVTDVNDGTDVRDLNHDKYALVMGSEGMGVKEEIKSFEDYKVYIKTSNVESLNVAVATSILLYELNISN